MINVIDYMSPAQQSDVLAGLGTVDVLNAFNAAIAAMPHGGRLCVPRGRCLISGTLDFSSLRQFELVGEGAAANIPGNGSEIVGNFAGPLINYVPSWGTFCISGIMLRQDNVGGCVANAQNVTGATVERCYISSHGHGVLLSNCFTVNLVGNTLVGYNWGGIGICTTGQTSIIGNDITVWSEGIRASGAGVVVQGCRVEVNKRGLSLGYLLDGTTWILSGAAIQANSLEANDVGVWANRLTACSIAGLTIHGSTNAPSGLSQIGIYTHQVSQCDFRQWNLNGTFSDTAIRMDGGSGVNFDVSGVIATNNQPGAKVWDLLPTAFDRIAVRL